MRIVTGNALAVLDGLVFDFPRREVFLDVVVTLVAQFFTRLEEQFLVHRIVRPVAGNTLAVFYRLMLDLGGKKIRPHRRVAGETDLARLAAHLLGKLRLVAGGAIPLGKRRVRNHRRAAHRHRRRILRRNIGDQRLADRRHAGIRRARLGNSVEEKRQPLLLGFLRATPCQNDQTANQRQPPPPNAASPPTA
ncbi:MAG: hypothetical protein NTZ16_14560 [Verrucomicrobia bacterium]|nr:hypothetical protein [Verrucomicrobiota bacterium]